MPNRTVRNRFLHTDDVAGAAWIAPRLHGAWSSIASLVPNSFERYVRVFHDVGGRRWSDVCSMTGAVAHPLMQWNAISRGWDEREPQQGTLGEAGWATLAATLGPDQPVTLGMWTGYGYIAAPGETPESVATLGFAYVSEPPEAVTGPTTASPADPTQLELGVVTDFGLDIRSAPLLELPHREYALFRGRLSTLTEPGWRKASGWAWFWDETANLAWPDDRSWFVLSEIDFDSTVVGCSADAADRILQSGLEAALITGDADLTFTGDHVNG